MDMVTRNMPDPSSIAIYALTRQGLGLARRLAADLGGTTYAIRRLATRTVRPFESLSTLLADTFRKYDGHVFVAATGIVIRCISACIGSKETDPAVVCLDQEGRFAVSLLSGHLGGANQLAVRCAKSAGGQAVVTTATDAAGVPSMDMLAVSRGLAMGNAGQVKVVNGALLDGPETGTTAGRASGCRPERIARTMRPSGCIQGICTLAWAVVAGYRPTRSWSMSVRFFQRAVWP